jgi:DNA repair protein SbcC/Rad50
MRILSISGQNIASLSDRFEIDFTAAPLNGAGLFAITGETGAGKSSILDAMCLALYGDAPRLATGASSDEVPDPSGDVIKAKDARAILRRGAVQGWAEVRFTAQDGQDYIARWQARRARDKADGKLQNVSRSLARVADQQILASQTTAVTEQIIALTGLTYEEFRRTVLLAQGDFDAFLRADTNERAGLLEKVTGTGLYRAVSTRVFERTEAARQAHDALALRRGEHRLLSEEEQTVLAEETAALVAENAGAVAARAKLQADLESHTRHAEAGRQVGIAKGLEATALDGLNASAPEREHLALIDKAEPLRPIWTKAAEAAARIATATTVLETKRTLRTETETQAENLRVAAALAQADFAVKEAEFKVLGPQWDEAAALDSQISSAATELTTAQTAAETAEADAKIAADAVSELRSAVMQAEIDLSAADAELSALATALPLAERWEQVRADLLAHAEAQGEVAKAETQAGQAEAKLGELQTEATALAAAIREVSEEEATLQDAARQLATQIAALEIQHPVQASRHLADLATDLSALHRAGQDHAAAKGDLILAITQEQAGNAGLVAADAAITAAAKAILEAEAQVNALVAPSEQADLALSEAARNLRLRLEPGTACPVCGSAEHPIHADAALADLAARLRTDLAAARKAAQDARTAQMATERQRAGHEAQVKQAKAAMASTKSRMEKVQVDWSAARLQALAHTGCPQDLAEIPDEDLSGLEAARLRIGAAQQAEASAQDRIAELRKDLAGMARRRDTLREDLKAKSASRDTVAAAATDADRMLSLARQAAQNHRTTAERHASAVRKFLAPLEETGDALNDPDLLGRLEILVHRVEKARLARQSARDLLAELAPKVSGQVSRTEAALHLSDRARKDAEARQQALMDLRQKRALLLGGEPTSAHRTRFNDDRKAALSARDDAQQVHVEAMNLAVAAATGYQSAEADLTSANDAAVAATLELDQKRSDLGLVAEDLETLFALGHDEIQVLRNRLRSLDDALVAARATLKQREQDLARLQQDIPETPAEELRENMDTVDAASVLRQQRLGAIHTMLATDAENRRKLAGLEAEIAKACAELDVWQAVNAAVGSRNGDRFARFAQSITLDVLADSANRHLADLNPRYRLRRAADLALQVEDIDMGGEARATRSLSGGERFLVSLALALALSRMGGKGGLAATLFIDEGFGSLDAASLDLAIDALEGLRSQGRQVGVISHVEAMKDRIPVRITVAKQGGGKSVVRITGG